MDLLTDCNITWKDTQQQLLEVFALLLIFCLIFSTYRYTVYDMTIDNFVFFKIRTHISSFVQQVQVTNVGLSASQFFTITPALVLTVSFRVFCFNKSTKEIVF